MQPALTPYVFADGKHPAWPANSDRQEGSPALYGLRLVPNPTEITHACGTTAETQGFQLHRPLLHRQTLLQNYHHPLQLYRHLPNSSFFADFSESFKLN